MSDAMITKSVRLTKEEAAELARVAQQSAATESALMKKWVIEGMRAQKLQQAVQAYMQGSVDLRSGAALAEISYNRFLQELQARRVVILEDTAFLDSLAWLSDAFDNQDLQDVLRPK